MLTCCEDEKRHSIASRGAFESSRRQTIHQMAAGLLESQVKPGCCLLENIKNCPQFILQRCDFSWSSGRRAAAVNRRCLPNLALGLVKQFDSL